MYVGLANQGQVEGLHYLQNSSPTSPHNLLPSLAANQVTDILQGTPLSDSQLRSEKLRNLAIKTGTSYGFRDAWAMGYTPDYTVGVWVGRADGSSVPEQAGRKTAEPILLAVYNLLLAAKKQSQMFNAQIRPDQLPLRLRYWLGDRVKNTISVSPIPTEASLEITYPINKAQYHLSELHHSGIQLTANAATVLINGSSMGNPLASDNDEVVFWQPKTSGFYKITVQDQLGHIQLHHVSILE